MPSVQLGLFLKTDQLKKTPPKHRQDKLAIAPSTHHDSSAYMTTAKLQIKMLFGLCLSSLHSVPFSR